MIEAIYPEIEVNETKAIFNKVTSSSTVSKKELMEKLHHHYGILLVGRSINDVHQPETEK